jgi:hypothetical protein
MSKALKELQALASQTLTSKSVRKLDGRLVFSVSAMTYGEQIEALQMRKAIIEHAGEENTNRAGLLGLWLACVKSVRYEPSDEDPAGMAYFVRWLELALAGELTPVEVWDAHLAIPNNLIFDYLDKAYDEGQRLAADPAQKPGNGLSPSEKADPDLKGAGGNSK